MSTLFKICFGIAAGLEFIFVPWFLKASKNGRCTKSQILKTICATLFVAAGVLASVIAQNRSDYAHYILIGLLFGWCGDFLLHLPPKLPFTLSGGLDNAVIMCILLVGGAFLFALSDMMLAVNSLRKPRPSYGYKITCIVTYFTAQFLLASTIFVISA